MNSFKIRLFTFLKLTVPIYFLILAAKIDLKKFPKIKKYYPLIVDKNDFFPIASPNYGYEAEEYLVKKSFYQNSYLILQPDLEKDGKYIISKTFLDSDLVEKREIMEPEVILETYPNYIKNIMIYNLDLF